MKYDFSKEFAVKMSIMLQTNLINYKYYELWCDEIIEQMDNPPDWIVDMAWTKLSSEANQIARDYAFSEPYEDFRSFKLYDFYIACLYECYSIGQIPWNVFLRFVGSYSDGNECYQECEYFYAFLNEFEESGASIHLEESQSKQIRDDLNDMIDECRRLYQYFYNYYQKNIKK